jgi:hypothetical protein
MKKLLYKVRWHRTADLAVIASVDLPASNDHNARQQADRLARQLRVSNTTRTIYQGTRCVE